MPVVIGSALAGRYEIGHELGHGGMATVYAATDRQTGAAVAVKVMRAELLQASGADRFMREIRLTARLRHPGIVPLLDTGVVDGVPFYTMPLVVGENLGQLLHREQQLGLEQALAVVRELLDALAHAHDEGILHRDIKPANILLSGGRALLADFGIARALEGEGERLTESGMAVGTAEYMSPEQAAADKIDQRSDLYSLGCVLYEMIAGMPPFTGPSMQAVRARHAHDALPSLRTVRPTVTRRLDGVIARVLAKVPADRYPSARAFRDALNDPQLLEPDAPPPLLQRVPRWAKGAAVVGALALGAAVVWQGQGSFGRSLDRHRVVGFPLVAAASVGGSNTPGEDVATLIGSALDRRESLRWVDGWGALSATERGDVNAVTAEAMRSIARATGAAWYLTGRIVSRGDSVDVLLELVDVANDSVAARPRASGAATDLWRVAIRSVNQVLPVLVPGTDAKDLVLAWADRDPGAVASFLAGEAAFRRARPGDALSHFRDAVRLDSGFALAAVRGAQAATADHRPGEARALVQRAVGRPMPPQYAEFTRGYVAYLDGRADSAVAAFKRAIVLDRELTAAWAQLGETYVHLVTSDPSPDAEAEKAFAEARQLDSSATHLLLHPIEIAWRRGDGATASPLVSRFLAAKPDSTQAAEIRLVDACGRKSARGVDWRAETQRNVVAVLSAAAVLSARATQAGCALAAYGAVLAAAGDATVAPTVSVARQGALVGDLAVLVAIAESDSARAHVAAAVARGDGGASLLMVAAAVDSSFNAVALPVAARDSARFGADLSGCSTLERCWILAVYHAARGHAVPVTAIAGVLASRVASDSTGEAALYAAAADAHARLARGDSAGARAAFRALLAMPFPPGGLLTWTPIGGFGLERLRLAQLLAANGEYADAAQVAATLDAPASTMYPLFQRASLLVRIRSATALGRTDETNRLRERLHQLRRSVSPTKPE
jgi:serine/threonine-protein kinase